ncbi:uracil-DNA glycosylase [Spiroplasma endosymbiont of Anurida maritima]|uniref:uracil-DNA glycosylase n=1 Tax=Spiroplasma endosymbiont of Anurida maritima TaxID=2967972 RepID=UPI0036D37BD1
MIKYDNSWNEFFENEYKKSYFNNLLKNIEKEYKDNLCFPKQENIFKIFSLIKLNDIKVVILGQDPYHNEGQALGYAFGVDNNFKTPPSLKNIYKEINKEYGSFPKTNDLVSWIKQGVFLYNIVNTVRKNTPTSHYNLGWEQFSENLLNYIIEKNSDIIFVLWGNKAKSFKKNLLKINNLVEGAHPSPFSYHLFKDQNFFIKINSLLAKQGKNGIKWHK